MKRRKDYYLSIEVLKMSEVAKILSDVAGYEIKVNDLIKNNKKKCLIWYHHLEEEIIWKVLKLQWSLLGTNNLKHKMN